MKVLRTAAAAGCAALAAPAFAQFPGFTGNARYEATARPEARRYGSISLYPVALYTVAGRLSNEAAGTSTQAGVLLAADVGVKPAGRRSAYELGGWYWSRGSSDLYQIHARAFATPALGAQLSYLSSTSIGGNAYTAFLLYDLASRQFAPGSHLKKWTIEMGLGMFIDASGGRRTTSATLFTQASLGLGGRLSLNVGQWYLRDRSTDLNRFVAGLGYNF